MFTKIHQVFARAQARLKRPCEEGLPRFFVVL